jgi:hypothetical protein
MNPLAWSGGQEMYSWEELQAGMMQPSGSYMNRAEIDACEAIRVKAEATLHDCQVICPEEKPAHASTRLCVCPHTAYSKT